MLESIRGMGCSPEFCRLNFRQTVHFRPSPLNGAPIESPYYEITKDGFIFLAMGYTGQKAAMLREGYIMAFNAMEAELRTGMERTKEHALFSLLTVVAEAADQGHAPLFIPEMVHARMAGLSCDKTARVLGVSSSTVSSWSKKLSDAGFNIPARVYGNATIASLKRMAGTKGSCPAKTKQLPLFATVAHS